MATTYLTPGVYVEEVDRGSKPIEGVGTAVAAFVGVAERGPIGTPTMIPNWTRFTETFGGFVPGAYLAHAVYGYFNNGGGLCFVVRAGNPGDGDDGPPVSAAAIPGRAGAPSIRALAKGDGAAPVSVEVSAAEDESFTFVIRGGGGAEERYEGLSMGRGAKNAFDVV
ncbi:MAG: phage tail sheath family protein, partial [Tepidiformaceae bacterium]